jgi:aminoglycoside phosphotransferase (APT) family kinase protein
VTQAFELRAIGWHQPRWKYRIGGLVAPYLGGTFGIAASMAQAGPSLFEEILAAAGPALGVERYLFAHPVGFSLIVRDSRNGRRSIIRIPSDEHSFERARTNFDNLTLLRGLNAAPVEIPVQVQRGEVRGKVFFMEHMLDGRNLHRTELTDERLYAAVAADATHRLIALHKATVHPVELTPAHSEHLIGDILRNARVALAGDKGRHVLPEIEECLLSVFAGKRLNLVFFHGDYTYDNLMFDAARHCVTGMFDWDLSRPQGLPLLDLLYFLITAERGRTGGWVPGIFADRVKHGFSPVEQQCIDTYCRALDIPADLVMPLFVLTCLHHVGIRMYSPEPYAIFQTYWTAFLHAVPGALHRTPAAGVL